MPAGRTGPLVRGALLVAGVLALGVLVGLDGVHAVLVAAGTGVVLLLRRLPGGAADEWPDRVTDPSDRGVRREVSRMSWGLHGYEGRVDRRAALRLHQLAARRLQRLGVDLDDPAQAPRARELLGDQAYAALTTGAADPPRYDSYARAVTALERLGERIGR